MNIHYKKQRYHRLKQLWAFDKALIKQAQPQYEKNLTGLIGVDEVGRGSLIGPVVAGAVMMPLDFEKLLSSLGKQKKLSPEWTFLELDDSKAPHLHHEKRLALSELLKSRCLWGIGEASKEEIEKLNIYHASLLASHRAVLNLHSRLRLAEESHSILIAIDGKFTIPGLLHPQIAQVKGDSQSAAMAAASVIAKAHRDAMVIKWAKEYPGYGWETNMGYSTPQHKAALVKLGITSHHRQTYKAVQEVLR